MACKYGAVHKFIKSLTSGNKTFIHPENTTLMNGAIMIHRFFHLDAEHKLVNVAQQVDHCNIFVFSFGIWYVVNPSYKKSPHEYTRSLDNLFQITRKIFPSAPILFKPTLFSSFQIPCFYPAHISSIPLLSKQQVISSHHRVELHEVLAMNFNEIAWTLATEYNASIIGSSPPFLYHTSSSLYHISRLSHCERIRNDPIHWCQCPGRPSPVADTAVRMALQALCQIRYDMI
jgi:hypothetical protein